MDKASISPISAYEETGYKSAFLTKQAMIILPDLLPIKFTVLGIRCVIEVGEFAVIPEGYVIEINSSPKRTIINFNLNDVLDCPDFLFLRPILACPLIYHPVTTKDDTFSGYTSHLIPELMTLASDDNSPALNGAVVKEHYGTLTLDRTNAAIHSFNVRLTGLRISPLLLVKDICSYLNQKDTFCTAKCQASLTSLYTILGEEVLILANAISNDSKYSNATYEKLTLAVSYCNEHFAENFTLADIAKHCGLARNYLSGLFKDFYRISFYDYLLRLRVLEAIRLLLTTDDSVSAIGLLAGFGSDATFGRVFKTYTGFSPRDFRKLQ